MSDTTIPLPTETEKFSDIIRFYIDATRVEMWSMELTAEDNRYTRVSGKPRSGIASEPLLADLVEKRDFLTAALDRHPPEPEVVRAGLAQLREPLASALRGLEITSDRIRSGVAASVSFCDLHTAEMIKKGGDTPTRTTVMSQDDFIKELKKGSARLPDGRTCEIIMLEDDKFSVRLTTQAGVRETVASGFATIGAAHQAVLAYLFPPPIIGGGIDFHALARQGDLHGLPPEVLTAENLLKPNEKGVTPLHDAAWFGHLDQVPDELLTLQNLSIENDLGRTPIMDAVLNGHVAQIPVEVRKANFAKQLDPYKHPRVAPPLPDQSGGNLKK